MGTFIGTLNHNEINNALFNMIISEQVFADNISGTYSSLLDAARVDGSLYGDKKIYIATDCIETHPWLNDAEAANLLNLDRNKSVKIQEIVLDQFRQIRTTVDEVLSKRSFTDEGVFGSYNSVLLAWMRDTKRIHDSKLYNVFIGNTVTSLNGQEKSISLKQHSSSESAVEGEAVSRVRAEQIAKELADLFVDVEDATRLYNDYGYMRSRSKEGLRVIWNSDYVNEIEKIDLPTMFHKVGIDKFASNILPGKYFGDIQTSAIAAGDNDGSFRSVEEADYTVGSVVTHVFAGDLIPAGCAIDANKCYKVNSKVICKIVEKLPPFMSAFTISTSFYNPRSLTTNHYITYGYNTLGYLKNYPFITVKEA